MAPLPGSTNPFDDDNGEQKGLTTTTDTAYHVNSGNPFDDDEGVNNNPALNNKSGIVVSDDTNSALAEQDNLPVEASWQYLGDLPYRRVPVYSNVRWSKEGGEDFGLAHYPPSFKQQQKSDMLDAKDRREMLFNSSVTKVAGCPHGGPIASITIPIVGGGGMKTTKLRLMTNAGNRLASIEMPPPSLSRLYSAADIMTIGFTGRTILIIMFRDSLCLTYDLKGDPVLPPFHLLPKAEGKGTELQHATIFDGGAAVLSPKMQCAIVELLDQNDDPSYANDAHLGARRILPSSNNSISKRAGGEMFGGNNGPPPHYAIVTPLPTAAFCQDQMCTFLSVTVLSRLHTASKHPEVFLSTSDRSVVVVDTVTTDIVDVDCRKRIQSPIVAMSFAPNGRFLACFTQASILTVISTSFETKVLDFDTSQGSRSAPQDMKWCGEDSVVLMWKKLGVLMVGPYGDWLRFPYEDTETLHVVPEVDCCRVVTDNSVEILQRVPPATAALLRIGSIEPSAMLLDASDAFENGSPASDENARAITKTGMLIEAIETCTDAATREYDISMQKRLLKAASYGMHFSYKDPNQTAIMGGSMSLSQDDNVKPSEITLKFVAASRKLRILNALRDPNVGLVITTAQYDYITATGIIARLVAINRPALATSICKYLRLPHNIQVYARSAKAAAFVMNDTNHSDSETAETAINIINEGKGDETSGMNGGAYANVAIAASKAGRPGVANLLLMLETSVADKVPALISTGSFADAMAVATASNDAEFVFFTLMEFEKSCVASGSDASAGQSNFLGTVISKFSREGFHTLRRYLETMPDVKNVMNLLLRAQRSVDAGSTIAKAAFEDGMELPDQQKFLAEASRIFGLGKDTGFQKQVTDEEIDLLKDQDVLRKKYASADVAPLGSSLTATMVAVINHAAVNKRESHRLLADVDKLAKKFRVPERRTWHIKVKAFADSEQWPQLRALGDSKTKSPIGFKPFAMAAIKGKQSSSEIMRYAERVTVPEERYDIFCEAQAWKRALEEAGRLRDTMRIANVRSSCNDPAIQQLADDLLTRIVNM